jgi:hypothetical protein
MKINVLVIPGSGVITLNAEPGVLLGELVGKYASRGTASVFLNGAVVEPSDWNEEVSHNDEVWLTGGVKYSWDPNATPEQRLEIIEFLKEEVAKTDAFQELIDIWRN